MQGCSATDACGRGMGLGGGGVEVQTAHFISQKEKKITKKFKNFGTVPERPVPVGDTRQCLRENMQNGFC